MRGALVVLAAMAIACGDRAGGGDAGVDGGALSAEAAAACVTAESCGLDQTGVSRCTLTAAGVNLAAYARRASIDEATLRCLAAARADCDAARRCLDGGKMPQACTMFEARSCAGSVLTTCTDATGTNGQLATAEFDCASGGETCVAVPDGGVGCGAGACSPGTAPRCNGDLVETCDSGILHDLDCAILGAACTELGGAPHCRGRGAACSGSALDPGQPLRCDASVLVTCWDGQEARFDCALIGEDCFPTVATGSFNCALGNQCDPAAFSSTCSGNTLRWCDQGRLATVDCAAAGFTTCDAFGARCLP